MKTCVLHVGMPKTGTTSIQVSLYYGLEDPAFHYVSLGRVNAVDHVALLCDDRPADHWRFRVDRYSEAKVRVLRATCVWRLRRALRRAGNRSMTPIISTENSWYSPPSALERLRDFLAAEGFAARVIAYIRPIKAYTESSFQQHTKWGFEEFDPISLFRAPGGHSLRSWSRTLELLERTFGRRNLTVRPFVRSALAGECAVQDFCQTVGIAFDPRAVIHSNESLTADAVRFLYAYYRFCSPGSQPSFHGRILLIQHFENLEGAPFRFHSKVFAPIAETIATEERVIRERYGVDISADLRGADAGPCVREKADLFRYSRAALDWLAETSGSAPIGSCEGESTARAVAAQVDQILRRQLRRRYRQSFVEKFRGGLRWLRRGD